jgi:tetratricopeptide (TPR) repeat protein
VTVGVFKSMLAEDYKQLGVQWLNDLAERRVESGARLERGCRREQYLSGKKYRVRLRGNHISYGGEERFRDSDCTVRLAMAVAAYEKAYELEHPTEPRRNGKLHGAHAWACRMVAETILRESPLRERFLVGHRGRQPKAKRGTSTPGVPKAEKRSILQNEVHDPRFEQLEPLIEPKYKRANSLKLPPEVLRLAATIRSEVGGFRAKFKRECDQQFSACVAVFRADYCQNDDWYAEQVQNCKLEIARVQEHLAAAESGRHPRVPWDMPVIEWDRLKAANICPTAGDLALRFLNLARLYHEQGEYSDAGTFYRRALELYRSASLPARAEQVVLPWIIDQIDNCKSCRRPDPSPAIDCRHETERSTRPNSPGRSNDPST